VLARCFGCNFFILVILEYFFFINRSLKKLISYLNSGKDVKVAGDWCAAGRQSHWCPSCISRSDVTTVD
jgi:hypothetical protein